MRVLVHSGQYKRQVGGVKVGIVQKWCYIQDGGEICGDLDSIWSGSGMVAAAAAVQLAKGE